MSHTSGFTVEILVDLLRRGLKAYGLKYLLIFLAICAAVYGLKKLIAHLRHKDQESEAQKAKAKRPVLTWIKRVALAIVAVLFVCFFSMFNIIDDGLGITKKGNADSYAPSTCTPLEQSPLEGRTILFLGSSVTLGSAAKSSSYVDYIAVLDSCNVIKEAVGGTTVAYITEEDYYPRLISHDASEPVDIVVIQLSSNDSSNGVSLGEVSASFDGGSFDLSTFAGGMEGLVSYAVGTWHCPVVIYSNPRILSSSNYNIEAYQEMVDVTQQIVDKWSDQGVSFLDLWNDEEFNDITAAERRLYMSDPVHPTMAGYKLWWTPKFEEYLYALEQ